MRPDDPARFTEPNTNVAAVALPVREFLLVYEIAPALSEVRRGAWIVSHVNADRHASLMWWCVDWPSIRRGKRKDK